MPVTYIAASLQGIKHEIGYACDPEKTLYVYESKDHRGTVTQRRRNLVTGINCSPDTAEEQFIRTKQFWSRVTGNDLTAGIPCYHGYISFEEGEADPQAVHAISVEFAERSWGKDCEVVVATHVNTRNPHSHFVVNSVRISDGKKLHDEMNLWKRRSLADRICREHGLAVREERYGRTVSRNAYEAEKAGRPTLKGLIRRDIDYAVRCSFTLAEMVNALTEMGYTADLSAERETVRPPGASYDYSLRLLGKEYSAQRLAQRILENRDRPDPASLSMERDAARRDIDLIIAGMQDDSLYSCVRSYRNCLDVIVSHPGAFGAVPQDIRNDIVHMDRLDRTISLMERECLSGRDELLTYLDSKKAEHERLRTRRDMLRNRGKKENMRGEREEGKAHLIMASMITPELREIRKQIRDAEYAADCHDDVRRKLESLRQRGRTADIAQQMRKEEMSDGKLLVGSGGPGREDSAGRYGDRGEAGGIGS